MEVQGFEDRFEALHLIAYRTAYPVLGERGDSQDVAQEAMARAYVRWGKIHTYAAAWVSRVALNLALDRVRKRRPVAEAKDSAHEDAFIAERLDLQRVLRDLPKRQREAVVLRYIADQSEADVAKAMDVSIGSVKTHASRGLAALREALGEDLVTKS